MFQNDWQSLTALLVVRDSSEGSPPLPPAFTITMGILLRSLFIVKRGVPMPVEQWIVI
jgi:hypothetical protein